MATNAMEMCALYSRYNIMQMQLQLRADITERVCMCLFVDVRRVDCGFQQILLLLRPAKVFLWTKEINHFSVISPTLYYVYTTIVSDFPCKST